MLVLGVGNLLLMDEGVGVRVVQELSGRFIFPDDVDIIDGGTLGLDLLPYLEDRECAIIIDAAKMGKPAGSVGRIAEESMPWMINKKLSSHQVGIAELITIANITGKLPKKLILIGIEPKCIQVGLEISKEVSDRIDEVISLVIQELTSLGLDIKEKELM